MASSGRKLRLAVIGGGLFARNNHIPQILKLQDVIQVVALWSNTKASAELAASLFVGNKIDVYYEKDENGEKVEGRTYEDVLKRSDVEAVDLIVTIDGMPEFVEKALSAGKHVISEKPMAPSVEEGREMLKRYRQVHQKAFPGLIWSVAEQIWYEPCWRTLMDYRTSGWTEPAKANSHVDPASPTPHVIGTPLVASLTRISAMNMTNKYYVTKWRATPKYQGGYILDGGVHEICKLRMMFGEVEEVTALTHQFREDLPPADTMTCSLRFKSGVLCTFTYTFTSVAPQIATATVPHELVLTGTTGSIQAKNNELIFNFLDTNGNTLRHSSPIENELGQLSIRREIESFALAALGTSSNGFNHYTPEQALQDVAVIQALLQSSKTGSRVAVEQIQ